MKTIEFLEIGGVVYNAPSGGPNGTAGDDTFTGTSGNDSFNGLGGNDTIIGLAGDDIFDGGDGNDRIHGGEGNDTLNGGNGDDIFVFTNNDGNWGDFIFGGAGTDTLRIEQTSGVLERHNFFNTSFDSIEAIEFATVNTSSVPSEIFFRAAQFGNGQISENVAFEGTGVYNRQNIAIYMDGAAAFDMSGFTFANFHSGLTVNTIGGAAAETVTGSATQFVTFDAGAGDDVFDVRGNGIMLGGSGIDTVTYANFVSGTNTGITTTLSTYSFIANRHEAEILIGSQYADVLSSEESGTQIFGGAGDDYIQSLHHAAMHGEAGDDEFAVRANFTDGTGMVIDGGSGNDLVSLSFLNGVHVFDMRGADLSNIEYFRFLHEISDFNRKFLFFGAEQFNSGDLAQDTLFIGDFRGRDPDEINVYMEDALSVDLSGLQFNSWVQSQDFFRIYGDDDAETIVGTYTNDEIRSGGGNDRITTGLGNDYVEGGDGLDTVVYTGSFSDYIITESGGTLTVAGNATGTDTLISIEVLEIGGVQYFYGPGVTQGTPGDDAYVGTSGADIYFGLAGNDNIDGREGDDRIDGGAGDDTINGWTGVDTAVYAGVHTDYIISIDNSGVVTISSAASGTDTLTFVDIIEIGGIAFGTAASGPSFSAGADHYIGSNAAETFNALGGNDVLYGLGGDDIINAGDGDDYIIGGAGGDDLDGGAGIDTASYADSSVGVDVTAGRFGYFGTAEGDTLTGIENLIGSDHNDVLYGDAGANTLSGGAGRDVLRGNDGDDILNGGDEVGAGDLLEGHAGNDILNGGDGNDQLFGGTGADQLFGGAGSDILYTEGSDTAVSGGAGYDYLIVANSLAGGTWTASDIEEWYGNAGNEIFDASGSAGRVLMVTNEGTDTLIGGLADDVLLAGAGNDIVIGGLGNDTLFGNAGADEIYGGAGSDIIRFDADDTVVNGGADYDYALAEGTDAVFLSLTNGAIEFAVGTNTHDQLSGENASWHVTIYGGAGNDTIYAGNAGSYLRGDAGQDSLVGGAGADYFEGGADADVIWMLNNGGIDFMYDFQDGTDFINLSLITGVSGFGDITVDSSAAASGWFSVDYGSGTLWLQAGAGATIDASDFIFAAASGQNEAPQGQEAMPEMVAAGQANAPLPEAVDLDQFIFDDAATPAIMDTGFDPFADAGFGEAQVIDMLTTFADEAGFAIQGDPELPDMFIHPEDIGYFDWG